MESSDAEPLFDFATHVHAYINDYIKFADQKAAFAFAACSTLLGLLFGRGAQKAWLVDTGSWTMASLFAFLAMVFLSASIGYAVAVVAPRRKGSPHGFIYWESILHLIGGAEYASAVRAMTAAARASEMLHHNYELAKIARRKYAMVDKAIVTGAIGGLFCVAYLLAF